MDASRWSLSRYLRCCLYLLGWVVLPGLAAQNMAGAAGNSPARLKQSGELSCRGAVRYRIGTSPWLTQNHGAVPVVLPVNVETEKDACRVNIPGAGLFEANANSQFSLARNADQQLVLIIQRGSVLYALTNGINVKVFSPISGVTATLGSAQTQPTLWTEPAISSCVGEAAVENNRSFHIANVQGKTTIEQNGKAIRDVGTGRTIQVSAADQANGNVRPGSDTSSAQSTNASIVVKEDAVSGGTAGASTLSSVPGPTGTGHDNTSGNSQPYRRPRATCSQPASPCSSDDVDRNNGGCDNWYNWNNNNHNSNDGYWNWGWKW